jgi:hypothetical protein
VDFDFVPGGFAEDDFGGGGLSGEEVGDLFAEGVGSV